MAETVTILIQGIDRASQAFDKVAAAAKKMEKELGNIASTTTRAANSLNQVAISGAKAFDSVGRSAEKAGRSIGQSVQNMANRVRELGTRWREMGENMVDMAENTMQGITVPLAALSAASIKASLDMSRLGSIVKANMAGVKGSIEEVQGVAERVFLQGLGKSAEDVGRTVANLKREFDTLNATQLENLAVQIHGVAEALGVDAAGVLEEVIGLTDKYKITTQQALDLVAAGYDAASLEGKKLSSVLKEVNGTASEMSKTMQNDPTVEWRGNLRELMATLAPLGDELLRFANDILPSVTNAIKSAVDWFTNQSDSTKNLIISIAGLLAILPLVTMTLGALIMMGSSVLSFFGTLGSIIARAGTAVAGFFKNFKNIGALGRVAGPIGLVVTALTLLYNKSKEFASFVDTTFKGVWDGLKDTFSGFSSSLEPAKAAFSSLGDSLSQLWEKIEPLAVTIGVALVVAFVAVIAVVNGLLNALGPLIGVFINVINLVVSLASAFLSLLMLDFDGFFEGLNSAVESFISILMGLLDSFAAFFIGFWDMLVSVFAAFGVNLNAAAVSAFTSLWNFIVSIATSIWSFLTAIWNQILSNAISNWNAVKAGIAAIWNGIKSLASSVWNGIKSAITNAVNSTASALSSAWSRIKSAATSAWNSIKSTATSAWNSIKSTVTSAMNAIANAVSNGFNRAKSAVSSAASSIRNILSSLAASAFSWGANLGSMFARGLSGAISKAVAAARSAAAKIKSYLGWSSPTKEGPGRDSDKWAPNLMNMLADGIKLGIPKLQAAVSGAAATIQQGIATPINSAPITTRGGITNYYTINNYNTHQSSDKAILAALDKVDWLYA